MNILVHASMFSERFGEETVEGKAFIQAHPECDWRFCSYRDCTDEDLAWADVIEEIKTVCWCGQGAQCNTRIDAKGHVIKTGEQILLGANDKYVALCRRHYKEENLGPDFKAQ